MVALTKLAASTVTEHEFATFFVGESLIGIDILQVQEINRNLELTQIPHAPPSVRGVVNLRGDVVTVIDLRVAFGLPKRPIDRASRNIILSCGEERIGLLVDRIADVVHAKSDEIDAPPANLHGLSGRFFSGVYKLEQDLLLILDAETAVAQPQEAAALT